MTQGGSIRVGRTTYALHHLPTRGQNIFYTLFLIISPLLNVAINFFAFQDFKIASDLGSLQFSCLESLSAVSGIIFACVLVLLGVNLAFAFQGRHRRIRHALWLFGIFSSAYLLINLFSVSYGIFAFKVQSIALLLVSAAIYISLNIVFLFWYWYFDYPDQVKHLHHPEHCCQISFPPGPQNHHGGWVPNFLDYLYLTIMVSNTLGPPENHSLAGYEVKVVQLIHSTAMLVLLVIFVSRAINTLS